MERVITVGDLSKLTPRERSQYYLQVCESVGLNPLTRPFDYLNLNGKTVLYSKKEATDQLRAIHRVSLSLVSRETIEGVMVVTARARTLDGRDDESTGAVSIQGLKGEALANAIMKSETKAKRRVTLSICGLSGLDESEVESIPGAQRVTYEDDSFPAPQLTAAVIPEPRPTPAPASGHREAAPAAKPSPMDAHLDAIKARFANVASKMDLDVAVADLVATSLPKDHPRRGEMIAAFKAAEKRLLASAGQDNQDAADDAAREENEQDDPAHDHG